MGSSILVQCHYRLQDVRARKVWCQFLQEGCRPLVTSAVDRRAPGNGRIFLTDLGGGLLQVEMVTLQEEDTGEYGCVVEVVVVVVVLVCLCARACVRACVQVCANVEAFS